MKNRGAAVAVDPFMEMVLWLERDLPASSNQLLTVRGAIDRARLEGALRRLVGRVALLRAGARVSWRGGAVEAEAWPAAEQVLGDVRIEGRCDLGDAAFRRGALAAAAADQVVWTRTPPMKVRLLTSADGTTSAISLHTTHALGDVVADGWLLEELLEEYHAGGAGAGAAGPAGRAEAMRCELPDLRRLVGVAPGRLAMLGRWGRAACQMMTVAARRDGVWRPQPHAVGGGRRGAGATSSCFTRGEAADLDFAQVDVAPAFVGAVRAGLREKGFTMNSLLCAAVARVIARSEDVAAKARRDRGRRRATHPVRFTVPVSFRPRVAGGAAPPLGNFALPCDLVLDAASGAEMLLAAAQSQVAAYRAGSVAREIGRIESIVPMLRSPVPNAAGFLMAPWLLGTNVFYSNPGPIRFDPARWAARGLDVTGYAGLSTVLPPYLMTLYSPTLGEDRLKLEALFVAGRAGDVAATFLRPMREELGRLAEELGIEADAPTP